jgi:hypothetical protein
MSVAKLVIVELSSKKGIQMTFQASITALARDAHETESFSNCNVYISGSKVGLFSKEGYLVSLYANIGYLGL